VVNNVPPANAEPPGYVALPFMAAGAPDRGRRMRLEIMPYLPAGAEIVLELTPEFAELLRVRPRPMPLEFKTKSHGSRVVYVPINYCGCMQFPEVVFPAKARIPLRLLVRIPEAMRHHEFELYARQLYEDEEVGRITWRLVPNRKADKKNS
jgi:hypothetical protein